MMANVPFVDELYVLSYCVCRVSSSHVTDQVTGHVTDVVMVVTPLLYVTICPLNYGKLTPHTLNYCKAIINT